jgi:alpha-glucosidase
MEQNRGSILHLYRRLIQLRKAHPCLVHGALHSVRSDKNVLQFERVGEGERLLVLLNLGAGPVQLPTDPGTILASTSLERAGKKVRAVVDVMPTEGLVIALDK